jgi:hypothetical protein
LESIAEKRVASSETKAPIKNQTARKAGSVKLRSLADTVQIGIPAETVATIVVMSFAD